MPEVVRHGDRVLVHTVGGRDLWVEPLKKKVEEGTLSREAHTAMVAVSKHIDTMECYACHSSWAPQCYGCHVKIDYSRDKKIFDWTAAGTRHQQPEHRTDPDEHGYDTWIPGEVTEMRSYLRWEDPPLGNNGEGRVSPLMPGCQVSATVVGPDGEEIIRNHIFRTLPHSEGSGPEGQLGSDMSPVNPHTTGKSRSCESCHSDPKALGYGIGGGTMSAPVSQSTIVDLTTADGIVIPSSAKVQIEAVDGMLDWSQVVTEDGRQTQTVGHHFHGSGPLTAEQRANMDRRHVCVGCHQHIPEGELAVNALHHAATMLGGIPETNEEHASLLSKITLSSAWAQVLGGLGAALFLAGGLFYGIWWWRRRT